MAHDILVRGFTQEQHQKITEAAQKAKARSTGKWCRKQILKGAGLKEEKEAGKNGSSVTDAK